MMKTYTEQWKDGKLHFGFYYVKFPNEEPQIYSSEYLKSFTVVKDAGRIEVVAPVPSYDKVKEMSQKIDKLKEQLEIATKTLNSICDIARITNRKARTTLKYVNNLLIFLKGNKVVK